MNETKYKLSTCKACLKPFPYVENKHGRKAKHCQQKFGMQGDDCWFKKSSLHQHIFKALVQHPPRTQELAELKERLLRKLVECIDLNELAVDSYLMNLNDNERATLLKYTSDELYLWLQNKYQDLELSSQLSLIHVTYPDLPDSLLSLLKDWEHLNRRRLLRRVKHGFNRSPRALIRLLSEPIRLASILHSNGKTSWPQMTLSDQLDFAKKNNHAASMKLRPFIKFLEKNTSFSGGMALLEKKKHFNVLKETHAVDYLPHEYLEERISQAKQTLTPDEFLIFWLVAKMGLSMARVYSITPRQVTINQQGRLVFKPAQTWSPLPTNLSEILESLTRKVDPNWPYSDPDDALPASIMKLVSPYESAHTAIFNNEVQLLRTSALMMLMLKGMMDRKTLSRLTGTSWPTLRTLEFQLSSDIHSFASHDLIKARNKAILGDDNEQ